MCVPGAAPGITFTAVPNVIGTAVGGDDFLAGSGTESMTETGNPGTLDYSAVPAPLNTLNTVQGITVDVTDLTGTPGGTVTSPVTIGVTDTFTGIGTFNGTRDNDSFIQAGPGSYTFNGEGGANSLDLSNAPAGTTVSLSAPSAGCSTGIKNNNGTASGDDVTDTFTCIGSVVSAGSEYQVSPGQTATVTGNGGGTLMLINDVAGTGVIVTLPVGSGLGTVTGDGYNFSFSGMTTIDGPPSDSLFVAGSASVPITINGGGGVNGISFAGAPAAALVNLSNAAYTVPAGLSGAGTVLPADTAMGGYGETITLNGISNVIGTTKHNDIIVGGPGPGTLMGGTGTETFVPTGGNDMINGGGGRTRSTFRCCPATRRSTSANRAAVRRTGRREPGDRARDDREGHRLARREHPAGRSGQHHPGWRPRATTGWPLAPATRRSSPAAATTPWSAASAATDGGRHLAGDLRSRSGHRHPHQPDDQRRQHPLLQGAPAGACINLSSQLYVGPSNEPFAGPPSVGLRHRGVGRDRQRWPVPRSSR